MKKYLFLILMVVAQFANGQNNMLEQYQWENRIVLIFGSRADASVEKQITELESAPDGVSDRDLLIFHIEQEVHLLNGKPSQAPARAQRFKDKYNVPEDEFRYILIGKDGGVKYNKKEFVSNETLFSIIDAMPMRQREIREEE